jgi:uncharacterized protein YjbK
MKTMMFLTIITLLTMTTAKSEENKYPMCADKNNWFEKNWCETVEFQKKGWEQGKNDLNKLPSDLAAAPGKIVSDFENMFNSIGNGIKIIFVKINNVAKN